MRITDIHIKNYRAFYGEHHICLDKDGKNLMVYGENGSGKSSLFTALQDFLKSSVDKIEVEENIFVPTSQKNTASIKVDIKESPETSKTTSFELKITDKVLISADKVLISEANKVKGFFDYRSLLRTHMGHTPDFLIIKRTEKDKINKALLIETKGALYAEDKVFQRKKSYRENERCQYRKDN